MEKKNGKIKEFLVRYEAKIVLVLLLVLVAVISFEVGSLKGAAFSQKPLIIEKQANVANATSGALSQAQNSTQEAKIDPTSPSALSQDCSYLGSKNSNKYHLPTCRYAKGIKAENRICFSSQDEARSKGYVADKNCVK